VQITATSTARLLRRLRKNNKVLLHMPRVADELCLSSCLRLLSTVHAPDELAQVSCAHVLFHHEHALTYFCQAAMREAAQSKEMCDVPAKR
jgi:hypothetical protein